MQHILTIFNENTNTWEGRAIEIDERETIKDIYIVPLPFFTQITAGPITDVLQRFVMAC